MKTWKIKPLYLGKITASLSLMWPGHIPGMPQLEEDFELSAPYLGFLLQSDNQNILVDTGISEKFIVDGKAWGFLPAEGGSEYTKKALEEEGLGVDDIDTVVMTHLHNDHAGNCHLFSNSRIIFQKEEWRNLLSPLPVQLPRMDYDPGVIDELKSMRTLMVDGDFELMDGIRLCKSPGHTLGSQVVAVNTKKGVVVLIGDLCLFNYLAFPGTTEIMDLEGNIYTVPAAPEILGPAVPHGLIYDSYAFYDSIYKIRALASREEPGYIIPGHEPSLVVNGL